MKTNDTALTHSESYPPKRATVAGPGKSLLPIMALTAIFFTRLSSAQTLQSAGDLILNLQSVDLNGTSVWTNQTLNVNSVGNMTTRNGNPLNVQSVTFGALSFNALYVNGNVGNAVQSALQVPSGMLANGPFSGEAWINADIIAQQDVMSYGFEGGSSAPAEVRDMGYFNTGYSAFTGNFGNSDTGWNPPATAGGWHYLAWTYDGTTVRVYQDAVASGTGGSPLHTQPSLLDVGCNIGGGSPFNGYIAAARLESGVLTPSQIANNFNAGPLGAFGLVANKPIATPGTNVFRGDIVTFTEFQSAGGLAYQWLSDNGTGGATFTPINGQTGTNYVLNTSTLPGIGTYEFEVAVTSGGTTVTSPPTILAVNAASAPIVTQNTTPAATSNLFIGSSITFTAAFAGNQTITNQWQISTDGGNTFQDLAGDTNNTLVLADLQPANSGLYRLVATNAIGHNNTTPVAVNVQPLSALPALQVAGQLLVNLQASDLDTNGTIWTNEINGIGDFSTVGGGNLNVTNLVYNFGNINALAVGGNGNNALNSALQVPQNIAGNGPVSVEEWIFPTAISGNNTVLGYGVQGGGGAPSEDREFDFGNSGGSAFSGNFGGDTGWSGSLSANTWHHVVYTFNGTTLRVYLDGSQNTQNNITLSTVQSVAVVGGGIAGSDPTTPNRTDVFNGNIAAVRVESGVLSASQILNNFIAGPTKTVSIVLSTPTFSPSNTVFYGDIVTVSVTNAQSLQPLTFQWQTDNGSGGASFSNITGQTGTNFILNTTTLPSPTVATNYEFRLIANGSSTSLTSAPATLTIKPAAPPSVLSDTSPSQATRFVGQQITFTGSFAGNQPITTQWQVSTNNGATFTDIGGQTGNSLSITNIQLTDAGNYRLVATNAFGHTNSTPAKLFVLPANLAPVAITAGEVIANLEPADLDTNAGVWHNESTDTNSVGDFTFAGTVGPLNVATVIYNQQPMQVLNVAGNGNNSVEALNTQAPSILLGANPCTMEAWCFATQVANNNTVVNYGDQVNQSGNLDRALNYQTQGYGAFTGYFGNADFGWNPTATANVWHYIAMTYDGNTVSVYQDGVLSGSRGGITLVTDESYISVGSGTGGGPFAGANPFSGFIASARVETGVLTAAQIAHNFAVGPAPGLTTLNIQQLAPLTSSFSNGHLTLSWAAGTLQEATNVRGPWTTDSSAKSPLTVTTTGPAKFYRISY